MINQIEIEPAGVEEPQPCTNNPMLLHCGGNLTTRRELAAVPTPQPTKTWHPLGHDQFVDLVETQITEAGFAIHAASHATSHEGNRYFGVLEIGWKTAPTGDIVEERSHGWVVGLRNSHDKTFPAGLVAGTRVFVCDNLSFNGLINIRRKHTRFAWRDIQHLSARAVGQLGDRLCRLDQRIEAYKEREIDNPMAHDIVVRAADCQAITPRQIPEVLQHWRKPEHEEFEPRTAWSLFNGFTEVHKKINPATAMQRGEALHGLFDAVCGVSLSN